MLGDDFANNRMLCLALLKLSSMFVSLSLACSSIFSARSLSRAISSSVLVATALFLLLSISSVLSSAALAMSAANLPLRILDVSKSSQFSMSESLLEEERSPLDLRTERTTRAAGEGEERSGFVGLSIFRLFLDRGVSSSPMSLRGAPCS
jgi:hypothetical protein